MKPLQIDFAPNSLTRALSRVNTFTSTLAGIALFMCLFFVVESIGLWCQHGADQVALQQLIAQQIKQRAHLPVVQKKSMSAAEINAVNTAIEQLNLPWRDLLDAVERATPVDVALLSLEPDAAKHALRGTAEAKDAAGMIAYIESLQQQDFFRHVELLRHEINEADAQKPIRFQFDVRWQGRVP